jgi:capsular polysaccharide biosynthesis protein
MELKKILSLINQNLLKIVLTATVCLIAFLIAYKLKPIEYKTSAFLYLYQPGQDESDEFKYDNYYNIEAIDKYATSFEKIFEDPVFVQKVLIKTNNQNNNFPLNLKDPAKFFKAKKITPTIIKINFKTPTANQGEQIFSSLIEESKQFLKQEGQNKKIWFDLHSQNPYIERDSLNLYLFSALAFILGFLAGTFYFLFKHYFSYEKATSKDRHRR